MKKLGVLSAAIVLALSLSGVASATSYWFNDNIDKWGGDLVTEDNLALDCDWDAVNSKGPDTTQDQFLTAGIDWLNDDGKLDDTRPGMNGFGPALQCWVQPPSSPKPSPKPPWCNPKPKPPHDSPSPVPEPCTMILMGLGLAGIALPGRNKIFKKK